MLWVLLALVGCQTEFEGDEAFECSDAADNDRDGYFDCDDSDCFGSPDCTGEDDDTLEDDPSPTETETDTEPGDDDDDDDDAPTETETETDTEDGEAVGAHLTAVAFTYTLTIDFSTPPVGLYDCAMTFTGSGDQVQASGNRVTFQGPWSETANDCSVYLAGIVWEDASGEAFHHFFLDDDVTEVTDWFESDTLAASTKDEAGWYITEMEAEITDNVVDFELSESAPEIYATLIHELDVTFTEE